MLWNVLLRSTPLNGVVAYCKDRGCKKRNAIRTLWFGMTFGPIGYGKCALAVREGRLNTLSPHGPHASIASLVARRYERKYNSLSFRKSECLMSTSPLRTCVQRSELLLERCTLQCNADQITLRSLQHVTSTFRPYKRVGSKISGAGACVDQRYLQVHQLELEDMTCTG